MDNQPETSQKANPIALIAVIIVVLLIAAGVYYFLTQEEDTNTNDTNGNVNANAAVSENVNIGSNTNTTTNTSGTPIVNEAVNTNESANSNAADNTNSATNINSSTTGWQTYEDKEFGFSLQLPDSWNYATYADYNGELAHIVAFTPGDNESTRAPFVSVRDDWSVEQEKQRINELDPPYTAITDESTVTIGSTTGTKLLYDSTIGLSLQRIIVMHGTTAYMFDCVSSDTQFETVVNTLTFL